MANLSLATCCSHDGPSADTLDPATFLQTLDHLQHQGVRELRLLHGEPALHPDFAWMLTRAIERGFHLLVATTGRMPNAILRKLERLPPDVARVLVHVALPGESSPAERERQVNLFRRLGSRVLLSVELHSAPIRFDYLLDCIERYGLMRRVRLEVADLTAVAGPWLAEAEAAGVIVALERLAQPSPEMPISSLPLITFSRQPVAPTPASGTQWAIPPRECVAHTLTCGCADRLSVD